ncbi:hypothetical protein ACTXT7_017551 [Hymenolepis weldensis]
MENLGLSKPKPTNHAAQKASGVALKLEGELDWQVCSGDQQITAQCFVTNRPDLDLLGLDRLNKLKLLNQSTHFLAENHL